MADLMRMKYENPKLKQFQIANELNYSTSILQRYRNDINMLSPYRINPNNNKKRTKMTSNTSFHNDSHSNSDVKGHRLTSNDLKKSSNEPVKYKKRKIKGGRNTEINCPYLDESFDNNNL